MAEDYIEFPDTIHIGGIPLYALREGDSGMDVAETVETAIQDYRLGHYLHMQLTEARGAVSITTHYGDHALAEAFEYAQEEA